MRIPPGIPGGGLRGGAQEAQRDGVHLLRKRSNGNLFHRRSRWLLA